MTPRAAPTLAAALLALLPAPSLAQGVALNGLLSSVGTGIFEPDAPSTFSVRFIPEFTFALGSAGAVTFDAEASVNAYGTASFGSNLPTETSGDVKPYRGWFRVSTSRFEARAGLQKVSFGSATIFRPLMWFDSLDPRDPLQITDGVYALLLRFYTRSNASVSAWTMYGNDTRRGWDVAPPDDGSPEFGGRVQVPLFRGELAAAYHRRKAAIGTLLPRVPGLPNPDAAPVPEDRLGLDGKWDLGVGFWLEGAIVHQKTPLLPTPYQLTLNAGLDYTFGVGRGLGLVAEQFRFESSARAFGGGDSLNLSAVLLRYPLGLLDELTGIVYYDWENGQLHRFATWRRTYDAISFNAVAFSNPAAFLAFPGQPGSASYAGTGIQVLFTYHF